MTLLATTWSVTLDLSVELRCARAAWSEIFGAGLQALLGGNITLYTELAERARSEAYDLMIEHATDLGANAVIAMHYDANEITNGITEVLAYGTAVVLERS
jgi:uncharacterized protein YbjQ (UPF0145 family)